MKLMIIFKKFIWPTHMNMSDYLNEFECLHLKLKGLINKINRFTRTCVGIPSTQKC